MTFEEFKSSLLENSPPSGLTPALTALWYDAKGDWDKAHRTAQDESSKAGAWVHAYLHRKEGDSSNARYWYAQARKRASGDTLENEWEQIATELLDE